MLTSLFFIFFAIAGVNVADKPASTEPYQTVDERGMPIKHTSSGLRKLRYDEMIVWEKPIAAKPVCYETADDKVTRIVSCGTPNAQQSPAKVPSEPVDPSTLG